MYRAVGDVVRVMLSDINGCHLAEGTSPIVNDDFFMHRGQYVEEWIQFSNPVLRTLFKDGVRIVVRREKTK